MEKQVIERQVFNFRWKSVILCRLFGHRINPTLKHTWCGRCGLSFDVIYGLDFWDYFTVPDE